MISLRTTAYLPIALALLACNQPQQTSQQQNHSPEIAALNETVRVLQERLNQVEMEGYSLKYRQEMYDNAEFDPARAKTYSKVETTSGFFLVSLEEVTPYLDGVRVKLHIGNAQLATYNGFQIVAEYGRRFPGFDPKRPREERLKLLTDYEATKREKSQTLTQVLRPGTWNTVYLVLPDIKPEIFGRLKLSIVTNQLSLSAGR